MNHTRGIIISGFASIHSFFNSQAADITASVCISAISGYVITSLHHLCHSIGLNSCNQEILSLSTFTSINISFDSSMISVSS